MKKSVKANTAQLSAFDTTMYEKPSTKSQVVAKSKVELGSLDISAIGINAVWEGRSLVFGSFSDYIKNIRK